MTRRLKRRIAIAIVFPVIAYAGWCVYVRMCLPSVQNNTVVGKTEGRIISDYGQPDKDWQGYQSLALNIPPLLPPGPIRTLIFYPRGLFHPEGGTLWVWVAERDGEWVCFESCWFAQGVRF